MSVWRKLYRMLRPNPLDMLLEQAKKEGKKRFLICWNRGLGDIPLGLYALVFRVREFIPEATMTFVTRPDLKEGFLLLGGVDVIVDPKWRRGEKGAIDPELVNTNDYDLVMAWPDPTAWLSWQLGTLTPKLNWDATWDEKADKFGLSTAAPYLGVHVETGTQYGYEKNWPVDYFRNLLAKVPRDQGILLFGGASDVVFEQENIVDLRGLTTVLEMLAVIQKHCDQLLVPDSGILSLVYYLDVNFPLKLVSLWADPHQGVLKQNVDSPNQELVHIPLIAHQRDLRSVSANQVRGVLWKS